MRSLLVLVVILFALSARGEERDSYYIDGNLLYEQLLGGDRAATGYIRGVHDGFQLSEYHTPSPQRLFCTPLGMTGGQLAGVVREYLAEDPISRAYPAGILVLRALVMAFPCPQDRSAAFRRGDG